MPNRNKTAGSNWERECATKLSPIFGKVITTRLGSKSLDNRKVDLMREDGNRLPFNFQCKNCVKINYTQILAEMPENEKNIILHKQTKARTNTTGRKTFIKQETLVVMTFETFMSIINNLNDRHRTFETPSTITNEGSSEHLL